MDRKAELPDEVLDEAAAEILDGSASPWHPSGDPALQSSGDLLRQMESIARIAEFHRETPAEPSEHRRWGRFDILESLGKGAFAEVFRAWDPRLRREVALKLLHSTGSDASSRSPALLREARMLARVRHPNVVVVHDAEQIGAEVGLCMELVHGRTLEEILTADGPLDEQQAVQAGIDLARALAAVHQAGLVHRDVKAQNVMRADDGRLVLMDFGAGQDLGGSLSPEGTPVYAAPELFAGDAPTAASDVYSAGVLLYHLVTGSFPIQGASTEEVRAAHERGDGESLRVLGGRFPRLAPVLVRALATDPAVRYRDGTTLAAALEEAASAARRKRRLLLAAAAALLLAVLGGAGALRWWAADRDAAPGSPAARLSFQPRDWILIGGFENRTGDPMFDGTLEYALERDLIDSRFVNVISRGRIDDALALMKKPADTRLDLPLAREVSLRDGNVSMIVTGRTEKIGSRYVLSMQLVDPATGASGAASSREAADKERVVPAIRELSNWLRRTLGETLPRERPPDAKLEKVTTPSLRALQLFSRADEYLLRQQGPEEDRVAEAMLREVVALDPDFASGQIMLAWTLRRLGRPREDYLPYAERAVELSGRVGERERYFILGGYYGFFRDEPEKALPLIEALVRLYPDHPWGAWKAYLLCERTGRFEDASRYFALWVKSKPNNFRDNMSAANGLAVACRDFSAARPFLERAAALASPEQRAREPLYAPFVELLPAYELWLKGDIAAYLREIDRIAGTVEQKSGLEAGHLAVQVGWGYLTLGKVEAARRLFERVPESEQVHRGGTLKERRLEHLALVSLLRGDSAGLRHHLVRLRPVRAIPDGFTSLSHKLMTRTGLLSEKDLASLEGVDATMCRGEAALRKGDAARAIPLLRDGLKRLPGAAPEFFLGAESLASAYLKQGELHPAAAVLEEAVKQRFYLGGGALWMRCKLQLAGVYRKMGRTSDAAKLERELRKLLAYADPDHPILLALQRH